MVGCVSGCVGTAGCHTLLHLCKSVQSVGDPSLQEGSVQICEICGRISQQEGWLRGYGKDAIPSYICVNPCYLWEEITARRFCEFCEFLWEEITARRFCEFCEFCGRKSAWLVQLRQLHPLRVSCVGMARMPYPPTLVLFDEHGGVGGDALHTTGEAKLLCSCCLD